MSAPGDGKQPEVTIGDTLNKALLTLLSIAELRQEKNKEDLIHLAKVVKYDTSTSAPEFQCSLIRAPCPPLLYVTSPLPKWWQMGDYLTKYDGRSFDTDREWGRVIAAMVLTYEALAKSLEDRWDNQAACCKVLNTFIQNYLRASGWNSEAEFRRISLDKFRKYYLNLSDTNTTGNLYGYFCRFSNPKKTEDYEDDKTTASSKIIFGLPEKSHAEGNSAFLYTMRRASLFCYFLLNCPTGSLIKKGAVAPASEREVRAMNPTKAHDEFEQICTARKKLLAARLIAELAAHTCENFLQDKVNLRVVTFAQNNLDEEEEGGEAKQRPDTTGAPGPSSELTEAFHRTLASFPAGCDLSQAAITSCQEYCALSLFAASLSTGSQVDRHYEADFLFKILKPGPDYELCVYSPCTQAALFASTQPSTAQSDMFKVMYTPLDVTTQVKRMHSSCAGTDTWNGRHPLTRLQGGANAYSALCLAHPTIAASASYAEFQQAHPKVSRALLTTAELFASYRVGLLVCYALPALGKRRGLLQTAVSTAACLVAQKNAGAAVHAVFNHCQYWLPLRGRGSLVAAAELQNDRYLLLLSDHNDKFSVQNVSTDEYNSLTGGWAQWYRQRLLFDLSCWVEGVSNDSASIQADKHQIAKAIDIEQVADLSSLGRTAFARWSLGQA